MMKLTMNIEQMKQIVESAPDWQKCYCTETNQRFPYDNYRNLDDLRTIIAQAEEIERLRHAIDTALHGSLMDDYGNRNEDGLLRGYETNAAINVLQTALATPKGEGE